MRKKDDFVTNSSSTNYIVACYRRIVVDKNSPTYDLLNDLVDGFNIANNEEEVREMFEQQFGDDMEDDCQKCIDIVNDGGTIIAASIPYGGEVDFPSTLIGKHGGKVIYGDY